MSMICNANIAKLTRTKLHYLGMVSNEYKNIDEPLTWRCIHGKIHLITLKIEDNGVHFVLADISQ